MSEKKGLWAELTKPNEREVIRREIESSLNQLSKDKDNRLLSLTSVIDELKGRAINEAEKEEKDKIKARIELLKLEKDLVKKQYAFDKKEKQLELKLHNLTTKEEATTKEDKLSSLRNKKDSLIDNTEKELEKLTQDLNVSIEKHESLLEQQWIVEEASFIEDGLSEEDIQSKKIEWIKPLLPNKNNTPNGFSASTDGLGSSKPFGSVKLEHLGGNPKLKKGDVRVKAGDGPSTLIFGKRSIIVTGMEWVEKGKRSGGKAAVGALVGGVITAPVTWGAGAIVGAAIGGRKRDDSVVAISFSDSGVSYTMYLKADAKEYQRLCKLLA